MPRWGGVEPRIYRLTNTFGKWARYNSHSVVATFCHNISHNIDIRIDDKARMMNLYYIDDVIDSFIRQIEGDPIPIKDGIYYLDNRLMYKISLGDLAELLYRFKREESEDGAITIHNEFERKMADTYLCYKDED